MTAIKFGVAFLLLVLLAGCQLPALPTTVPPAPAPAVPDSVQVGPVAEKDFFVRFQVLDALGKPRPGATVEIRPRYLCKPGGDCTEPMLFSGKTDAGGWVGPVKLTGAYEDPQILVVLWTRVFVDGQEIGNVKETAPDTFAVYLGESPAKGSATAPAAASPEELARLEREHAEAAEWQRQADLVKVFPFEGKGAFEGTRYKIEVGEGFTSSDGGFAITLTLINERGETVDSRLAREGDDEGLFIDSHGDQILRNSFLVEKIYRKVSPGGGETYSAEIR